MDYGKPMVEVMKAYTYILRCSDNSLYTGWTTDLKRRLNEHNAEDLGAKYTKTRRPCKLVYYERFEHEDEKEAKRSAMRREWYIKNKLTKKQKEDLVNNFRGALSNEYL